MDVAKQLGTMDHVAIMGISLRKGYRSIGLGSELMKVAEEIARGMRCKCLRLAVYPTNKKAIGLYRKFGFRKVASIPKQIQRKGKLISEDIMIMNL
jgi:ribosomal protein S18 acetylase RimI-like enzyme